MIPDYPNHLRPCQTVRQAVEILLNQKIQLKDTAIVHYVDDRFLLYFGGPRQRSPFSYNFFSPEGRNVGTYIPDLKSFQFQSGTDGRGRHWSLKSPDLVEQTIDITPPIELCRICNKRPVENYDNRCNHGDCLPF